MKKVIVFLILTLLFRGSVMAVTFDDIINQVRLDLNDTGPTSTEYHYSQSDMVRAVNFIHKEICREARIPETSYSTTTSPGVAEYNLPTDISGVPTRVAYYNAASTSTFKRLLYKDMEVLDIDNASWESRSTGLPTEYYLRANKVGLLPAPSVSYSTTTWNCLKIYYVQVQADITTSTTSLATSPFGGYPQYQTYGNLIVAGVEAILTKKGYDLYYSMLAILSATVKENYDRFIRNPDRREY